MALWDTETHHNPKRSSSSHPCFNKPGAQRLKMKFTPAYWLPKLHLLYLDFHWNSKEKMEVKPRQVKFNSTQVNFFMRLLRRVALHLMTRCPDEKGICPARVMTLLWPFPTPLSASKGQVLACRTVQISTRASAVLRWTSQNASSFPMLTAARSLFLQSGQPIPLRKHSRSLPCTHYVPS